MISLAAAAELVSGACRFFTVAFEALGEVAFKLPVAMARKCVESLRRSAGGCCSKSGPFKIPDTLLRRG